MSDLVERITREIARYQPCRGDDGGCRKANCHCRKMARAAIKVMRGQAEEAAFRKGYRKGFANAEDFEQLGYERGRRVEREEVLEKLQGVAGSRKLHKRKPSRVNPWGKKGARKFGRGR